jgi:uncharacterized Tic20 family protein
MEQQNTTGQPEQTPVQPVEAQKAEISNDAKNFGMLCHLLGLFTIFVGALVIWLLKIDTMSYVDYHGKEALNFQITLAIGYAIAFISSMCMIGFALFPLLYLLNLVFCILAAVAASRGEYYKYPWCLRLVK